MNPAILINVLLGAVGGAIGGTIGYLVADAIVYKLEEARIKEEEIEAEIQADEERDPYVEADPNIVVYSGDWKPTTDYSGITRREKANLEELASKYQGTDPVKIDTKRISADQWLEEGLGYGKQTISFYEDDKIFSDEREESIPNAETMVGTVLEFGFDSRDPNVVYIRNERMKMDFEIIRVNGSYASIVMGMSEEEIEEAKGTQKSNRRRKRKSNGEGRTEEE